MKKFKVKEIFAIVFIIIHGVLFILGSLYIYYHIDSIMKNGRETTAKIILITITGSGEDMTVSVEVEYYVDNIKYVNELGSYHSGMSEGQTVTIKYLPDDPDTIIHNENAYFSPLLFFIMGTISISIGVIIITIKRRKIVDKDALSNNI